MVRGAVKARAVGAAAAQDLNDELTIILSCITLAMQKADCDDPLYALLTEALNAARRCGWKASGLLQYSARGIRPTAAQMESLIDD